MYRNTYREIRLGVSAFLKKEQMKVLQNYETFASIVSMALGGKDNSSDNKIEVSSTAQLEKEFGDIF